MKLEDNVPMPEDNKAQSRTIYPFLTMEVGQSVFFEGETTNSRMQARAHQVGKKHGKKFISRTVDGGLRIWRTA